MKRIVIVGGGFAGVRAALAAARSRRAAGDLAVTLVSRDPWLTIRPRLYEATLDGVRVPLDEVLGPAGVERLEGTVSGIDAAARTVAIDSRLLRYDRLILAAGSRARRPPAHAFGVDGHAEALALQRHLAALPAGPGRLTAVVVGAGFTGIEVATELAARLRAVAAGAPSRVVLVGAAATVAPDLGPGARRHVEEALASLRVETRVGVAVAAIDPAGVTLGGGERIDAATTVWTGGFAASPLAALLPVERDPAGRLPVDALLRVRGVEAIYAAGDVARALADPEHVAPMSCQYAIPMGERAGLNAAADLLGAPPRPFAPPPYVTCLDLGEAGALFMQGWEREVRLTGFWAKLMKRTINQRLIYPS
jgi:NADH:quinone reductase (non-electrogenic)